MTFLNAAQRTLPCGCIVLLSDGNPVGWGDQCAQGLELIVEIRYARWTHGENSPQREDATAELKYHATSQL